MSSPGLSFSCVGESFTSIFQSVVPSSRAAWPEPGGCLVVVSYLLLILLEKSASSTSKPQTHQGYSLE